MSGEFITGFPRNKNTPRSRFNLGSRDGPRMKSTTEERGVKLVYERAPTFLRT